VHLVVTSRPFELRHDARLRTLAADELQLELPEWSSVASRCSTDTTSHGTIAESVQQLSAILDAQRIPGAKSKEVSFAIAFRTLVSCGAHGHGGGSSGRNE